MNSPCQYLFINTCSGSLQFPCLEQNRCPKQRVLTLGYSYQTCSFTSAFGQWGGPPRSQSKKRLTLITLACFFLNFVRSFYPSLEKVEHHNPSSELLSSFVAQGSIKVLRTCVVLLPPSYLPTLWRLCTSISFSRQ